MIKLSKKNNLCLVLSMVLSSVIAQYLTAAEVKQMPIPQLPMKKGAIPSKPSKVDLKKNDKGEWRLWVDDVEFPVHGAGGAISVGMLEQLKAAGGNCVRSWGIDTMETKVNGDERFIDLAYRLNIMVVPGLWVQHERHGYDYSKPENIKKQREAILASVRKYKNHPAVLMWGLGNEMEGFEAAQGSTAVLKEVNELAKLVKKEDPAHPVMSIIAGTSPEKLRNFMANCPDVDVLGINSYSGAGGAGETLRRIGWMKPFAITEFGVSGHWEVGKTSWGAPIEPTSQEKARSYYATQKMVFSINDGKEMCLGTFCFLWGWKQECTATWYGMYLPTLEKLPQVDAMTREWTGKWPENRCPKIKSLSSQAFAKVIKPERTYTAFLNVKEPNGDKMRYDWVVRAESTDLKVGGDAEAAPPEYPELIRENNKPECVFKSPKKNGNYRLFVTVHDGRGGAATANFPFRVE